ncbi:MAG: hypothetical protein ACRDL1_02210, partial [Solirubrobacterales bacterium]
EHDAPKTLRRATGEPSAVGRFPCGILHACATLSRARTDPSRATGHAVIYIWVRETTDWEDEQAFVAQMRSELEAKVELWNDTFNIPFHAFRQRVREIARLNHSRVEGSSCAVWDEIPEGGLVLPVDDDDWFAPDVGRVLESEFDSRATGYYWISSFIQVPIHFRHRLGLIRRRISPRTPPKWVCTTNNYAMVKTAETKPLLASHVSASRWVEEREANGMRRIERRLSIMNRTLASQTSLAPKRSSISRRRLMWRFHRYKTLYRAATAPELSWCRPYVGMMAELMEELRVSGPAHRG